MEQRVVTLFHHSLEATMNAGEILAPLIAEASEMVVHTLLAESKILLCGNGVSGALAQSFSSQLTGGFQRERPGLPAMALNSDGVSMGTVAQNHGSADTFAHPVRALGQPGDLLIIISSDGGDSTWYKLCAPPETATWESWPSPVEMVAIALPSWITTILNCACLPMSQQRYTKYTF
ncbi:SIS domain-containing protein [Microbulbifer sp. MLAF003]|uniref:D-sedoheptulose-7-phosphate isomerase n=1 Tax=Microbulbifer sp. MLAF003 TaxID=3032582 RepID=UPI003341254B